MADPLQTILTETAAIRAELEQKRQRYWQLYTMAAPMAFAIICAIAAMNTDEGAFPWPMVGIATALVSVIGFIFVDTLYRKLTKAALLGKIATTLGLSYNHLGVFPVSTFEHHHILPNYDIHRVEDGFTGTVGGVALSFEEAVLSERYKDQEGKWQEVITFWGLLVRIGIGKQLNDHTIVMPRNKINNFFRTTLSKFKPVNLVSPTFEKRFDTISSNQVEARYVLDPAFMERFLEADALAATKWLSASFHGREIAFAIQRFRPMFEIGRLWKPLNDDSIAATVAELNIILRMIETLKLNPHTGLGGGPAAEKSMSDADFYPEAERIYKENIALFADMRIRRNWELASVTIAALIVTPCAVLGLFAMTIRANIPFFPAWLIGFALYPVCWIVIYQCFNWHYRHLVKNRFLYRLAASFGLQYRRGGAIPLGDLYDHHVLPAYGAHLCEEGFHGRVRGFDIEFQDFTVSGVARAGRFDYRALFNAQPFYGIAMRIGLNRTFHHHTVLMPSFMANGWLKRTLHEKFIIHEDVGIVFRKFRERYTILSTDQIEARVIFDPATIERVMTLGEMLKAHWLEISFMNREMVIIAGQSRNFFEVGTLMNPPSVLTIEKVLAEIDLLKSILDILEMNPRTGPGTILPERKSEQY